jgi:hypothetical protein
MNVHQACLTTAEQKLLSRWSAPGVPVADWNTHKALSFDATEQYNDLAQNMHALARNSANNKDAVDRPPMHRNSFHLSVIDESFIMLEKILENNDSVIVQIIEAIYIAASRESEGRSGESVMLAWGVCEQLVSILWNRLIVDAKKDKDISEKISGDRLKKLRGRDYTASVMVEVLEITGKIDNGLYRSLEIARKTRNHWAHEMRVPKQSEAHICLEAAQKLLKLAMEIDLSFSKSSRGSGGSWWIWWWEQTRADEGG